eukprot:gene3347-6621_t
MTGPQLSPSKRGGRDKKKLPIVGYSGWYPGKINGRTVKPDVFDSIASAKCFDDVHNHAKSDFSFTTTKNDISLNSPNLIGQKVKEKMKSRFHRPYSPSHIVPIAGYSGWYVGKGRADFGKPELPRQCITKEVQVYTPKGEGGNLEFVLNDITQRLEDRFPTMARQNVHVKQLFQTCDTSHSGYCTVDEFRACLLRLNVVLAQRDEIALINYFLTRGTNKIRYHNFVNTVCPKLVHLDNPIAGETMRITFLASTCKKKQFDMTW